MGAVGEGSHVGERVEEGAGHALHEVGDDRGGLRRGVAVEGAEVAGGVGGVGGRDSVGGGAGEGEIRGSGEREEEEQQDREEQEEGFGGG